MIRQLPGGRPKYDSTESCLLTPWLNDKVNWSESALRAVHVRRADLALYLISLAGG